MASELERLFFDALDLDARPYAYSVFSTHYTLRDNNRSLEFYERGGAARVTFGDHRFAFQTAEGAADAARQLRALLSDFVCVENILGIAKK
jgi:hypothetical protein